MIYLDLRTFDDQNFSNEQFFFSTITGTHRKVNGLQVQHQVPSWVKDRVYSANAGHAIRDEAGTHGGVGWADSLFEEAEQVHAPTRPDLVSLWAVIEAVELSLSSSQPGIFLTAPANQNCCRERQAKWFI